MLQSDSIAFSRSPTMTEGSRRNTYQHSMTSPISNHSEASTSSGGDGGQLHMGMGMGAIGMPEMGHSPSLNDDHSSATGSADRSSPTSPSYISSTGSSNNRGSLNSSHSSHGSFHSASPRHSHPQSQQQSFAELESRQEHHLLNQLDPSATHIPYEDFGILAASQSSHSDHHSHVGLSAASSPSTWQQAQLQPSSFADVPSVLSPSTASAHRLQSQDWERAVIAEQQRQRDQQQQQQQQQQQLHAPALVGSYASTQYNQGMLPLSPDSSAAATIDWASRLANATVADVTAYMSPNLPLLSPNTHDLQLLPNGQFGNMQEAAITAFLENPHGHNNSLKREADDSRYEFDCEEDSGECEGSGETTKKAKSQRRQGVTCDQCRVKHLRCDLAERKATGALPTSMRSANGGPGGSQTQEEFQATPCSPCATKGIACTKIQAPPARRFPRPSRSGKRIEQARQIHGTLTASPTSLLLDPISSATALSIWSTGINDNLGRRVLGGSLSLRLLTCFFATSHMQMPVVEFDNFSARYNLANGDPRLMSFMGTGGDPLNGVADIKIPAPGLQLEYWPGTRDSTISSPGTTETLIAAMQAWAAHYTDAPIAFGSSAKDLGLSPHSKSKDSPTVPNKVLSGTDDYFDNVVSGSGSNVNGNGEMQSDGSKPRRRPKRKQGVACDTCRLRRVRCDITERPEGLGCSRCEDKRINCTDEYIQTKVKNKVKKKGVSRKGAGDEIDRVDSLENGGGGLGLGPNSWHGRDLERESWRDAGPKAHLNYEEGRGKGMMDWGRARQAFCHELFSRALNLMHKHSLLHKPSVEGVQCIMLLVQLMERIDPIQSQLMSATACQHMLALKLQARFEVDERDKDGVEKLLSQMQHTRVYLSTWTRGAIASGMLRQPARLVGERAVEVSSGGGPPAADMPSVPTSSTGTTESYVGSALVPRKLPETAYPVELSGEMGLTFTIMALMQVGALSRFIAKHIDVVIPGAPADLDPSKRFPSRPTIAQMRKLTKACHAVWESIDALMIFFDRCTVQARDTMERLKPFQPLGWIATIKVAGAMLMLAIYRVLGERLRVNATFMAMAAHQARAFSDPSLAPGPEDMEASRSLRSLFELGKLRTLTSSRRIAHLVHFLLPRQVFHTSGVLLRQLFPVAQFLARTPPTDEVVGNPSWPPAISNAVGLPSSAASHIDPTSLELSSEGKRATTQISHADVSRASSSLTLPADTQPHLPGGDAPELGHFDAAARKREVGWCIEGLAQMGFAWPEVESEIKSIEGLLGLM